MDECEVSSQIWRALDVNGPEGWQFCFPRIFWSYESCVIWITGAQDEYREPGPQKDVGPLCCFFRIFPLNFKMWSSDSYWDRIGNIGWKWLKPIKTEVNIYSIRCMIQYYDIIHLLSRSGYVFGVASLASFFISRGKGRSGCFPRIARIPSQTPRQHRSCPPIRHGDLELHHGTRSFG